MSDNNKIAGRILPKARPMLPGVDKRDAEIEANVEKQYSSELWNPQDEEIRSIDEQIAALEERKSNVVRLHVEQSLRAMAQGMDPNKVEELCEKEPWKKGGLTQLSRDLFGFVPEKFWLLAQEHEEDSTEYQVYKDAAEKAEKIYDIQLKKAAWRVFAAVGAKSTTSQEHRGKLESIGMTIHQYYKRNLEKEEQSGGPIRNSSGRIRKAGMLLGEYFMRMTGDGSTTSHGIRGSIRMLCRKIDENEYFKSGVENPGEPRLPKPEPLELVDRTSVIERDADKPSEPEV